MGADRTRAKARQRVMATTVSAVVSKEKQSTTSDVDPRLELFSPVHSRRAADDVLAIMLDALRGGMFEPGDTLPSQEHLARQLGVSRRVLREAIDVLRDEGILTVKRGASGGMVVRSTGGSGRVLSRIQGPTRASLRSILEARRLIECDAAYIAAGVVSTDELIVMRRLVSGLEPVMNQPDEFWELDIRLHFYIADVTRNPVLGDVLREVFARLAVLREPFPYAHVEHREAIENQRVLLRGIESKDPLVALAAMDEHLAALEEVMLGIRLPLPLGMRVPDDSERAPVNIPRRDDYA